MLADFEQADDDTGTGLRWAVGNALEVVANDGIAGAMIKLATERRYGRAREMVVLGLGKLQDPRVIDVLLHLLADDEVVGHAVMALGRLRASTARTHTPLLAHYRSPRTKASQGATYKVDA